jgi:hypothetical protein
VVSMISLDSKTRELEADAQIPNYGSRRKACRN